MKHLQGTSDLELTHAERCFREATNKASLFPRLPYRSISMANLASCMMRRGRIQDAIHMFRQVVTELPRFPQVPPQQLATVHAELSAAYEAVGELDNSIRELSRANEYYIRECERLMAQITDNKLQGESRTQALGQAINAWRSAVAMRMSIGKAMHTMHDLESARQQFVIVSAESYLFHEKLAQLTGRESPVSELDYILNGSPSLPPITHVLLEHIHEMDLDSILKPLAQAAATDYWVALQCVGACQLDLLQIPAAVSTYKDCVRFASVTDDDNFMRILSEVCHAFVGTHDQLTQESIGIHEGRNSGEQTGTMSREEEDAILERNEIFIEAIEEVRHHIFRSLANYQERIRVQNAKNMETAKDRLPEDQKYDIEEFFRQNGLSKEELQEMLKGAMEDALRDEHEQERKETAAKERAQRNALRRKGLLLDGKFERREDAEPDLSIFETEQPIESVLQDTNSTSQDTQHQKQ